MNRSKQDATIDPIPTMPRRAPKTNKIGVRLTEAGRANLEYICKAKNTSQGLVVEQLINEYAAKLRLMQKPR